MLKIRRLKNKSVTKLAALFPAIADRLIKAHLPLESKDVPWTPVVKPLAESKIALITTAGIHHRSQKPFDMADPQGDPTYRILDRDTIVSDYTITHDYYDHRDADTDLNIVLPIKRISEIKLQVSSVLLLKSIIASWDISWVHMFLIWWESRRRKSPLCSPKTG